MRILVPGHAPIGSLFVLLLLLSSCQREELHPDAPDTIPPLPPADVVIEQARDGYIFLGWSDNRERDLGGYFVYRVERDAGGAFERIAETGLNYYIDGHLSYDTAYFYYVVAYDQAGNMSRPSAIVSATAPNSTAPDAPEIAYISGHNEGDSLYMRLEWQPGSEYDLLGYDIYRSTEPSFEPTPANLLDFTEATVFDDRGVTGTAAPYYYAIVAKDRGGKSSPPSAILSDIITAIPELIAPTEGARLRGRPSFSWHRVPSAVQYRVSVSRLQDTEEIWSALISDTGADTYMLDYNGPVMFLGRSYYWRVAALSRVNGRPNGVSGPRMFQITG